MPKEPVVSRKPQNETLSSGPECFVVMPISDPEGYNAGHFQHVYDDLLAPACRAAGLNPVRADQVRESNLIHADVLRRLLDSPMVLCDLSSRNPNVLFELGLRQAFDQPVVLVQEVGTPKIFDIAPLRYTEYRNPLIYHEVIEDQTRITNAIVATQRAAEDATGVNSIVRILSLSRPATLSEVQNAKQDPALQIIRAELGELRDDIRSALAAATRGDSEPARENPNTLLLLIKLLEARLQLAARDGAASAEALAKFGHERDRIASQFAASPRDADVSAQFRETLRMFDEQYDDLYAHAVKMPSA